MEAKGGLRALEHRVLSPGPSFVVPSGSQRNPGLESADPQLQCPDQLGKGTVTSDLSSHLFSGTMTRCWDMSLNVA